MYFSTRGTKDIIYRLNTHTLVLDSFDVHLADLPLNHLGPLACSADGRHLYAVAQEGVLVFDTKQFEIQKVLPYIGEITISPDNDYICISTEQGIYILSALDHQLLFHDTTEVLSGYFTEDGDRFYAARWDSAAAYLYQLELESHFTTSLIPLPDDFVRSVYKLAVSPDENEFYLYRKFGTFDYLFDVYDRSVDSIVFRKYLTPGAGVLWRSRSGDTVYITNPGTILNGPPPAFTFGIYDTRQRRFDSTTTYFKYMGEPDPQWAEELVLTPDEKTMVTTYLLNVQLYDLETKDTVANFIIGTDMWLFGLTVKSTYNCQWMGR